MDFSSVFSTLRSIASNWNIQSHTAEWWILSNSGKYAAIISQNAKRNNRNTQQTANGRKTTETLPSTSKTVSELTSSRIDTTYDRTISSIKLRSALGMYCFTNWNRDSLIVDSCSAIVWDIVCGKRSKNKQLNNHLGYSDVSDALSMYLRQIPDPHLRFDWNFWSLSSKFDWNPQIFKIILIFPGSYHFIINKYTQVQNSSGPKPFKTLR